MYALQIRNLSKVYKNGTRALDKVSLDITTGDFFALLGPNGAGKSTIIGIVTSLIRKTQGKVEVLGYDIDAHPEKLKRNVGVVPQEFNFSIFEKVINIVTQQAGYYGVPRSIAKKRAEKYLKAVHLWDRRDDIARNLSGGMKRRLMIARALVHEPRLLILDEPTAGVDIEIRRSMWELMREINNIGMTIILTTHYLEEAESLCRNIAIIDEGKIIENDAMANVVSKLQREVFVLTMKDFMQSPPVIEGYEVRLRNNYEIEVEVAKEQGLNGLFNAISNQSLHVSSMRTRSNRLEELFMRLVENKNLNIKISQQSKVTDSAGIAQEKSN